MTHRHPDLPKAFAELGLEVQILRALREVGFEEPSPIQLEMVPAVLAGKDVIGQARTGTGKTAAFGMPTLQMINPEGRLQMLVLTPTRELAVQVVGELRRLALFTSLRCVPVYGGTGMKEQLHQLGRRPHIAVGTPGRVMDVIRRQVLRLDEIRFAVLDEVDRMLDIGFRDDIKTILGQVSHPHQTIFVSATISDEIKRLAHTFMRDPVELNVSQDQLTVSEVSQAYCAAQPWDKFRLLRLVLKREQPGLAIVFCNTKHGVRKLAKRLYAEGINAREIHGDLIQEKRERVMSRFRQHKISVLVATDLASRGIDVHEVTHIINYDLPRDSEAYVHRIGRTARMGASGRAITFVTKEEGAALTDIEKLINCQIEPLIVEGFEPRPPPDESAAPASRAATGFVATFAASPPPPVAASTPSGRGLTGKYPVSRRRRRR